MKINLLKRIGSIIGIVSLLFLFSQCTENQSKLANGTWRAELQRKDGKQIVFNFNLKDSSGQKVIYISNAKERLRVDSISITGDSIHIQMPFFGSYFDAKISNNGDLNGVWTKEYGSRKAQLKFHATPNDTTRIPAYATSNHDVTGSWETVFDREKRKSKAIGLFQQEGNTVTGTFLTPVGDYRYLQGVVSGDTLKISGFDGCHALLFTAIIDSSSNTLREGEVYSINSDPVAWKAEKKDYESLPASYAVENIPEGTVKTHFSLKDFRTGKKVSLEDSIYQGKVVVISILGSWCPNCMDETNYLSKYYDQNKDRGVEFIGVAFERTADFEQSKKALQSFFHHFDINYPVLYSGVSVSDPDKTEKIFPNLPSEIHAYPTTIFIDKEGYVRKIHSGFNGPATGKYFDQFKEEFNDIINGLLAG